MSAVESIGREPACAELAAETLVARGRELVAEANRVVRSAEGPVISEHVDDLDSAADLLLQAEQRLRRQPDGVLDGDPQLTDVTVVLVHIQALRLSIGEARVSRRSVATAQLQRSLRRLRSSLDVPTLLQQIPVELGTIGFSRSLLSRLRGTTWSARSAFAHSDASLADSLVEVGNAVPGRIGREEPETEMVRQRTPILVRDAPSKPRIHRELISLADTRDYVAAPIVAHGTVIALLHVDRHSQYSLVDSFDRDLLGLFAEGVGLAFERARYQEKLVALRRQIEAQLGALDELAYCGTYWDSDAFDAPAAEPAIGGPMYQFPSDGPLGELTRREVEVLRHLAGGATNQDIATRLGVSTGTVKTHMKNLLRKLGASNRADAAARFHRLTCEPHERHGGRVTRG